MPIYEYKCPACGMIFEEWVKTHDTGPQNCPACGQPASHIVSHTTFVLKGGGWYVTEYGNRKGKDDAPASASEPAMEKTEEKAADACAAPAEPKAASTSSDAAGSTPAASSPASPAPSSEASAA